MPSQFRPQLFGWIDDLPKGPFCATQTDGRLLYANDNYCAFIRKTPFNQIFYLVLSIILLFLSAVLIYITILWLPDLIMRPEIEPSLFLLIISIVCILVTLYGFTLPQIYQDIFARKGEPIIFNRKTKKAYINESYFYNFTFWRNPLMFFVPFKRRIKEYDWDDLHCVVIHNYSRNALVTTILMVCKPGTHQTISHIMLDPARAGVGSYAVWQWINNFMYHDRLARLNDGRYLSSQEAEFNRAHINRQGWPKWMLAAFNANSPEHLAQIKQQYGVE